MPSATKTKRTQLLATIFGEYRGRILVTYIVTLAENLFELFYPSLTGLAVNGLLKHDFVGLELLLGIWLLHTATGVFRQSYDTRVFSAIYTDLATGPSLNRKPGSFHFLGLPVLGSRENSLIFLSAMSLRRSIPSSGCWVHWCCFFSMTRGAQSFA